MGEVIRYHGSPITPVSAAIAAWRDGHAMISFARREQAALAFAVSGTVALDNGAFSFWKAGKPTDWPAYLRWVEMWRYHPAFDWCLIPDIIDGTEAENDRLIVEWALPRAISVPVWHLHESMDKLDWLCAEYPRISIGSSGKFASIGTPEWWERMNEAMEHACDSRGYPKTKLHGLRQMDPEIFSVVPYASVDSTHVARSIGIDTKWTGTYVPTRRDTRAIVMRQNISNHASSAKWPGPGQQRNLELFG